MQIAVATAGTGAALNDKIRVYNFNVLGYHTYVVGSDLLVVHNRCKLGQNMEKSGNLGAKGQDAHHLYPQKFKPKFEQKKIFIDDAANGIWMDASFHRSKAKAYNKAWEQVLKLVDKDNAFDYARKFMKEIYNIII